MDITVTEYEQTLFRHVGAFACAHQVGDYGRCDEVLAEMREAGLSEEAANLERLGNTARSGE